MAGEPPIRSRASRKAAEEALLRVLVCYGREPEFVVLGGLVPDVLCGNSTLVHAGTTDVDVQVDLEIACGAVNSSRLEKALRESGFVPDGERCWRWVFEPASSPTIVKFELLADLQDAPEHATIKFDRSQELGAINLRRTGCATRDVEVHKLCGHIDGIWHCVEAKFAGLAGFLLSKAAAASSRRLPKDWYDIAYVLIHNDAGGSAAATEIVNERFGGEIKPYRTSLRELQANFATAEAQGSQAYTQQFQADNPEYESANLATDAVLAVKEFCGALLIDVH